MITKEDLAMCKKGLDFFLKALFKSISDTRLNCHNRKC